MNLPPTNRRSKIEQSCAKPIRIFSILVGFAFGISSVIAADHAQRLRVKDAALAEKMIEQGGKLVADYGSFKIIDSPEPQKLGRKVQLESGGDEIELNAIRLKTLSPELRARRNASRGEFRGRRLHLIQFVGPIKPEWREMMESLGGCVVSYVPQNAYLVSASAEGLRGLQSWASTNAFVQWDGEFANDYKLHPGARTRDEFGLPQQLSTDCFAIQLLIDSEANPATLALIETNKLAPVQRDFQVMRYRNLIVRLPANVLTEIAAQPDVVSIQPYNEPDKQDERQAQIIAGNINGSSLTGPGYLNWLSARGFTQQQFDASAFVVDISDSGIDNGTVAPGHFGLYRNGDFNSGSRVVYNRVEGTAHAGSSVAGCDGHGNLNAHILGGFNNSPTGFPHTDSAGYRYGLGICPFVKLGSSVIFDPDQFTSPNYANLQSKAYASGARISANSWGATNNGYTIDAQAIDALVRDAQPDGATFAAPGNQEMVIVFAAGNRGSGANTVGAPGTAKNVITVGASESVRSMTIANGGKSSMGTDGCGYGDSLADAANDMATFSSRGPCSDGRQKPDLVAPGTHIVGGVGQSLASAAGLGSAISCFKASSICALSGAGTAGSTNNFFPLGQQFYTVSSGTSHAAPAVAGACALLRQFFLNVNLAAPSPAMTKAYLLNSTRFLTGAGANDNLWSPGQGMGGMNLGRALDDVPRVLRDQRAEDIFTASGQTRVFTGRIARTNEPLRITVAWTDAPGSTTGNAFNNDLDLTVEVDGVTYLGNQFSGAFSIAGGAADPRNNVESVFLPAGVFGDVTVTVTAANINSDGVPNFESNLDQDFALVIYNATNTTVPKLSVAAAAIGAEGYYPTNGAVDSGEMITLSLALKNTGTLAATNLTVTLVGSPSVLFSGVAQSYGTLINDGAPRARDFTFTAGNLGCGQILNLQFAYQDDGGNSGVIPVSLEVGRRDLTTLSFTNGASLIIPDSGAASIFPSTINVTNVSGTIQKVTATLRGFSHSWPDDVDVLLVGPAGQKVMLLSDAGGGNARNGVTLTFDSSASASAPDSGALSASSYKPTNIDSTTDNFPAPAPAGPFGSTLSSFNGSNPNGVWSLYIQDDGAMDSGSLTQGWVLSLTTSNLVCVEGQGNQVDLALDMQSSSALLSTDSNLVLTVLLTNRGPSAATFVAVTNVLPLAFSKMAIIPSVGTLITNGNNLIWKMDVLSPGSSASLILQGSLLLAGSHQFIAFAGCFTSDVNADNNADLEVVTAFRPSSLGTTPGTNTAPQLSHVSSRIVHAGSLVQFAALASDSETALTNLSFSLTSGAAGGATIGVSTGLFSWLTSDNDVNSTNYFTIQVADDGIPGLTDMKSFSVAVVSRPLISMIAVTNGIVTVSWSSLAGQTYRLQYATNLLESSWQPVEPDVLGLGEITSQTNAVGAGSQQFYRVLVLP